MNNLIKKLLLAAFSLIFLLGCGLSGLIAEPTPTPTPTPGPADAARAWIDAIVNQDGNQILKYTCRAQRDPIQETSMWTSAFAVLAQMLTNRSVAVDGDVSDLKFEPVSAGADQAEVRVYGELRVAVLGNAQAHDVDERWQMIYENETWRWCGSSAGGLPVAPANTPVQQELQPTHTPAIAALPTATAAPAAPTQVAGVAGQPASSGPRGRILFYSFENEFEPSVHVIDVSDMTIDTIVDNTIGEWGGAVPVLSPDGQKFAFIPFDTGENVGETGGIGLINTDGSNHVRIVEDFGVHPFSVTWSPDSQKISFNGMFVSDAVYLGNYVINVDGTNLQNLTNFSQQDFYQSMAIAFPNWSPAGNKISFVKLLPSSNRSGGNISVSNVDGSQLEQLTSYVDSGYPAIIAEPASGRPPPGGPGGPPMPPAYHYVWSPDGQAIAFVVQDSPENWNLNVINVETKAIMPLLTGNSFERIGTPLGWSPDGQQIIFSAAPAGIYSVRTDGSDLRRLVTDLTIYASIVFSPDGQWIAFTSAHPGQGVPYIMNIDGSGLKRLTEDFEDTTILGWLPE